MAKPSRPFLGFLVLVAIVSGAYLFTGDRVGDIDVQPGELHGLWILNYGSVERIRRLGSLGPDEKENTIEIRKDGTCHFNTHTAFHPYGSRLVSKGKWNLKKGYDNAVDYETWYVEFDLRPNGNATVGTRFYLKKQDDRLIMYDFIDDPDQNQFVEFVRTAQTPF